MKIEYDPAKNERNIALRALSFDRVVDFNWETALYNEDDRKVYPETRVVALGFLDGRLHAVCFTPIDGGVRIISFRRASRREARYYEEKTFNR